MEKTQNLGAGSFGNVTGKNNEATKKFKTLRHFIQEVILTIYMRKSRYIINLNKYNIENLEMKTERWSCSLRDSYRKIRFTEKQKMRIFIDMVKGLSHLHERQIVHSDFKPSNILINLETKRAVICDLGLSSVMMYAKKDQTAPAYRPKKTKHIYGHDMFGLCLTSYELISGKPIPKEYMRDDYHDKKRNRTMYHFKQKDLRKVIRTNIKSKFYQKILCKMIPDNIDDAITPKQILQEYFNETTKIGLPEIFDVSNEKISKENDIYLIQMTGMMAESLNIKRDKRCYYCIRQYLMSPESKYTKKDDYQYVVGSMLVIFSSVFGRGIELKDIMKMTEPCKKDEIYYKKIINDIFKNDNVINLIMAPNKKFYNEYHGL